MKSLIVLALMIMLSDGVPISADSKGINFFKGTFNEALAMSRKTGKPVFVDVYATWCGPCKQLKRTSFRDAEAAAYFNANFINISVNGETPEGQRIRSIYNVASYPTLLITDGNGRQLAKTTGFMKPYILINFGRRVVP